MTFRRFLAWIIEKLVELQLFALLLIAVKFVLPISANAYVSFAAFGRGVNDQWFASVDEASYMTRAFMGGSYLDYGLKTYEAALYVVGTHFYFWCCYLITSILACVIGRRGYVPRAWLAFVISAIVLAVRLHGQVDPQNFYLAAALFVGGVAVVTVTALFGLGLDSWLSGARNPKPPKPSANGRVRFDLSL